MSAPMPVFAKQTLVRYLWSRLWDAIPSWGWTCRLAECFPDSWFDQNDVPIGESRKHALLFNTYQLLTECCLSAPPETTVAEVCGCMMQIRELLDNVIVRSLAENNDASTFVASLMRISLVPQWVAEMVWCLCRAK